MVIVDVPDPSTSQLNRFYTREFFAEVHRVLTPGGVLSFSLGAYEDYLSPELARLIGVAHRTLRQVFAHVLMLPGRRIFFLASDGELTSRRGRADRSGGRRAPLRHPRLPERHAHARPHGRPPPRRLGRRSAERRL